MNTKHLFIIGFVIIVGFDTTFAQVEIIDDFNREYNLVGERSLDTHYYLIESDLVVRKPSGKRMSANAYKLYLKIDPGDPYVGEADKFTCLKYYTQSNSGQEVSIPSLAGWSYDYNPQMLDETMLDEDGQIYGIPESRFKDLVDENGAKLSSEAGYQIYSTFQYYHSYTQYAEPSKTGKGIQDLKMIGDRVILAESFVESPIPGELAEDGSVFKPGESILEFKGFSIVDDEICAIVGFDWGECNWTMFMKYGLLGKLKVAGGSLCQGDIYLDLETFWVRKLETTLSEMVFVTKFGFIPLSKNIPVTHLVIREIKKEELN